MTRPLLARTIFTVGLACLAACGGDLDPGSRITSLRLLAVGADKTYAHAGEEIQLNALYHDPVRDPADIQWAWTTCLNPASTTVLGCFQKIALDVQKTGKPPEIVFGQNKPSFTVKVPTDALAGLPAQARRSAAIGVVVVVCPGKIGLVQNIPPGSFQLPITCNDGEKDLPLEQWVIGLKRIFLREKDRNANPAFSDITFDGKPWPAGETMKAVVGCDSGNQNRYDRCGGKKYPIGMKVDPATFEKGVDELGVPFEEQVVMQYYATEGIFEYDVKRANDPQSAWVARPEAKGKLLKMWFVLRDNRGGVSWQERLVQVD